MTSDREPKGDVPPESNDTQAEPRPPAPDAGDPAAQIPVPGAMSAAEIDERAKAVEAVRRREGLPPEEPNPDAKS
jgi:hypothetical protein